MSSHLDYPQSVSRLVHFFGNLEGIKINVIYGNELYYDTPKLIFNLYQTHIFEEYLINVSDYASIIDTVGVNGKINILFIESCSNLTGQMFDYEIVPVIRKKSKKLFIIIDNTWLSHDIF